MSILDKRANLRGKVAVIMGGADGMGRGITLALAQAGVEVAFCDIDPAAIADTLEALAPIQPQPLCAQLDVCDRPALDKFWNDFDERHERLDILVNVAGGVRQGAFLDSTPQEWERLSQLNYGYVVHNCHHAAQRMRASGQGGSIINITTIEGYRAAPGFSVYAGLKAGIANLSRSLATELGPYGIRLNCIAPDQTPTPGLSRCIDTERYDPPPAGLSPEQVMQLAEDQARNAIPLGRMGRVEDIENSVLFLASDLAAYLTGQTLHVDGGAMASAGWYLFPKLGFRNRVPLELLATDAYDER